MSFSFRLVSGALFSTLCAQAYQYIEPTQFVLEQSPRILQNLGARDSLLKVLQFASEKMIEIIASPMVQRMARGTLSREEWDRKYMQADALYIYNLGCALAKRAENETEKDRIHLMDFAEMFLGYGKHFERLKKYGLSETDRLISPECDQHIDFLSKKTSTDEFYLAILTDMIPYVIFANYLLHSIDPLDNNPWEEYAKKYGDLNNKYPREKLGKTIQIANEILLSHKIDVDRTKRLFLEGFTFEEWFIRTAFSKCFLIDNNGSARIQ